ncbi:U6 snRNA complex subunit LSM4 [Ascoidea rubescens DSM 1968]|uniref:LSM complex subunit LSM4 n=1 Tax=Ascoidea rubescens DSM 1968 TaxID=1344418 RepID=A0A1D2VPB6_9ASCO|nr:Sm-like ribonucleo protein [Ascoidea rubescens DSM 1968]ODV63407.1 Sm-like ribonucleo protein [Ascoidea rubescens DSM 1968]
MLPLYLLTAAKTQPISVELKNGETLNGHLVNCDSWMNLTLKDVIQTSANADLFLKIEQIYIRGSHIKYLRLPNEIMDQVKEQNIANLERNNSNSQFNQHMNINQMNNNNNYYQQNIPNNNTNQQNPQGNPNINKNYRNYKNYNRGGYNSYNKRGGYKSRGNRNYQNNSSMNNQNANQNKPQ